MVKTVMKKPNINSWFEAQEVLDEGKNYVRKIAHNTWLEPQPHFGSIGIRLHNTFILTYKRLHSESLGFHTEIRVDNGGWETYTTKERLNQFLPSTENFHINVYQENFEWYWNITFRDQRKKRRIAEYNNDDVIKIWVDDSGQYDFQLKDKKGRVKIG